MKRIIGKNIIGKFIEVNEEIQSLNVSIKEQTKRRLELIQSIQDKCLHEDFELQTKPSNYEKNEILARKTCRDCGLEFTKPQGMDWQVCKLCWSPMKEDSANHFKCTKCVHTISHT